MEKSHKNINDEKAWTQESILGEHLRIVDQLNWFSIENCCGCIFNYMCVWVCVCVVCRFALQLSATECLGDTNKKRISAIVGHCNILDMLWTGALCGLQNNTCKLSWRALTASELAVRSSAWAWLNRDSRSMIYYRQILSQTNQKWCSLRFAISFCNLSANQFTEIAKQRSVVNKDL